MKNAIRYILILIVLVIIFIILNFYKSKKNIFEDIMIFGLWGGNGIKNEYESILLNVNRMCNHILNLGCKSKN